MWCIEMLRAGAIIMHVAHNALAFADAINLNRGVLTNKPVAEAHDLECEPLLV